MNLSDARTWPEFQARCLQFQQYWQQHGRPDRRAMWLSTASANELVIMLLQRQINLIDGDLHSHLTDPKVLQTLLFYAQAVAGPNRFGVDASPGGMLWAQDLARGDLCACFTPDWAVAFLKQNAPELAGRLAMMPLPRFDPDDAPTSTWGGTMIAIPRTCKNPDQAWKLLEFLYLSPPALEARRKFTDILPPVIQAWDDPSYHRPDPFFSNQPIGQLYASLAGKIPPRHVTSFTTLGTQALAGVLSRAVQHVNAHGADNLESACRQWLQEADDYLKRIIAFGRFDP